MSQPQLGHCSDCRWWKGSGEIHSTVSGKAEEIGTCFVFPPIARFDYRNVYDWCRPRTRATDGCGQLELRDDGPDSEATE